MKFYDRMEMQFRAVLVSALQIIWVFLLHSAVIDSGGFESKCTDLTTMRTDSLSDAMTKFYDEPVSSSVCY